MNFTGLQVWGPDKGGREDLAPKSRHLPAAEAGVILGASQSFLATHFVSAQESADRQSAVHESN
jgi:hypothetical protein